MNVWLAGLLTLALAASPLAAGAVEYRLRVANLDDGAYFHFAENDRYDRDSPFRLPGLEPAIDRGSLPNGVFVASRSLVAADVGTARSFEAVEVRSLPDSRPAGQWQEVRWEGTPGERSVWVVRGYGLSRQAVVGVGLTAPTGEFRHYIPHGVGPGAARLRVGRIGLDFVEFWEGREGLWRRFLAPKLDLHRGIAAVVGENPNAVYPDAVFLIIDQPPAPTTYDIAIAWHNRSRGRSNPFLDGPGIGPSDDSRR